MKELVKQYKCISNIDIGEGSLNGVIFEYTAKSNPYFKSNGRIPLLKGLVENSKDFVPVTQDGVIMEEPVKKYKCISNIGFGSYGSIMGEIYTLTDGWYMNKTYTSLSPNYIENSKDFNPVSQDGETYDEMRNNSNNYKYECFRNGKWINAIGFHEEQQSYSVDPHLYRRKPEPEYRPYTIDDLDHNQDIVLKVIKPISSDTRNYIAAYNKEGVILSTGKDIMSYQLLFERCTYLDGSPCGVLID